MNNKPYLALYLLLLFVLQLVICDNIDLGPYFYICLIPFIVVSLPRHTREFVTIIECFAIGLALDLLSDGVAGLNAAAATLIAFIREPLYHNIINSNRQDRFSAISIKRAGLWKYILFLLVMNVIYLFTYILLDAFSFKLTFLLIGKLIISSAVSTIVSVLAGIASADRQ